MGDVVFSTEWFQIERIRYKDKDYYNLVCPDGAAILALTDKQEVILVRQFRPVINQRTLEVPAGQLDAGEDPIIAAERELYEETGYRCPKLCFLGVGPQISSRTTSRGFYYYGEDAIRDPNFVSKEDIEIVLIPKACFREVVLSGELNQMMSLSLVLLASWKLVVEI